MSNSAMGSFVIDDRFWKKQKEWPKDFGDHVFLAGAFLRIGRAVYSDAWPEWRGQNEPNEPEEPDDDCDDRADDEYELNYKEWEQECAQAEKKFETMWSGIARRIGEACGKGFLVSAVRAKEGGEMIPLEGHDWNTESFDDRFFRCDISFVNRFSKKRVDRRHWIYVTRSSLDRYVARISASGADSESDLPIERRSEVSKARIRTKLKQIYADPKNDRPNVNNAYGLVRAELPDARKRMVFAVLNEPEFANQRRCAGEHKPRSRQRGQNH